MNNWKTVSLAEVSKSISAGGTPFRKNDKFWKNGTINWLKISDLKGKYITKSSEKITEEGLKNSSTKIFPKNTVLYSIFAVIGATGILKEESASNQAIVGIIPDTKKITSEYLYYCLINEKEKLCNKKSHATQDNINLKILREHKILLPPLDQQNKIVEILEKAEKLKEKRKQANELADEYLKSLFLESFGEYFNNKSKMKTLNEICEKITDGTHITPKYKNQGIPFLRVTDLTESNSSKKFISEEEHKFINQRCNPEKGDILYSKNGTIGIAKMINWDWKFSIFVSLCLMKPKKEMIIPKYLESYLNTPFALEQAKSHSKKGTISNLHLIEIKKILVPVPNLEEQNKFLKLIHKLEKIKENQKESEKELDNLFNSLMQKAFKGELVA